MNKLCKRILLLFLLFALLLPAGAAFAIRVEWTTTPAVITEEGAVTLGFSITNDSQYDISQISIVGYGVGDTSELEEIVCPPGLTFQVTIPPFYVTRDMIGQTQVYRFTWLEAGQMKTQDFSVLFGQTAPAADMTGTRTVSKETGKEGDKITLTYSLKNPGTMPMTDVVVKDSIAGSDPISPVFTIESGGSETITYEYTLSAADAVSQPVITYTVGTESKTLQLEPITLKITNISVVVDVTQAEPTQEGVLFTIMLKNDGNLDINQVQVTDELGNKVNQDTFTLAAANERALTYLVQTESLRNVSFTIKGTDALSQPYENKTRSMEARPYVDPSNISISLAASIVEPLSDSGRIKVRFVIQNDSVVPISDVSIEEAELGVQYTDDILPGGETPVEKDFLLPGERELVFTLSAKDPSGAAHTYQARVAAAYASTPPPVSNTTQTPASTADPSEGTQGEDGNMLVTVLIVLAVLMAVAGVALVVLSIYESKKNNAMRTYSMDDNEDSGSAERSRRLDEGQDRSNAVRAAKLTKPDLKYDGPQYKRPLPRTEAQAVEPARSNTIDYRVSKPQTFSGGDNKTEARPVRFSEKPFVEPTEPAYPKQEPLRSAGRPDSAQGRNTVRPSVQDSSFTKAHGGDTNMQKNSPEVISATQNIRNRVHRVKPVDEEE